MSKSFKNVEITDVLTKVFQFFSREKKYKRTWYLEEPIKRLSFATGIHEKALQRFFSKDADSSEAVEEVVQSIHKDVAKKTVTKKLDDFDEAVVRRTIHGMYKNSKPVTMTVLQEALKEKDIDVSLSTVKRTVKRLGFGYSKNGSGLRFVKERQDIVSWRHSYLLKVRKFRQEGRPIVYLDETWLNTNHVVKGDWLDHPRTSMSAFEPPCKGCGRVIPSGKGTRLIILDAGSSQQGLIPGCGLIFESKTSSSDYHDEMNKEHFTEWFKDTLIPKLLPQSVIVMDNAPYHSHLVPGSKVPNTGSNKSEISAWLDRSNICYDKNLTKTGLLDLVRQNKPRPRYVIDELAAEHGHEVLRLPPHHCELNPIEMVWSDLKGFVGRRNSSYKKKDIIKLFEEAKSRFNAERWASFETHVVKEVEEKLWSVDGIRDEGFHPFVICLTEDGNDSDTDDCFDEGVGDDIQNDEDTDSDTSDTLDNSGVDEPCKICHASEPPQKRRKVSSKLRKIRCDFCEGWVHDKCWKGAARKEGMCPRCHSILKCPKPGQQLSSNPMDTEA